MWPGRALPVDTYSLTPPCARRAPRPPRAVCAPPAKRLRAPGDTSTTEAQIKRLLEGALARLGNDPYLALQVEATCSVAQARAAFRRLALRYHPDKNVDTASLFRTIKHAYDTVADPAARRRVDRRLAATVRESDRVARAATRAAAAASAKRHAWQAGSASGGGGSGGYGASSARRGGSGADGRPSSAYTRQSGAPSASYRGSGGQSSSATGRWAEFRAQFRAEQTRGNDGRESTVRLPAASPTPRSSLSSLDVLTRQNRCVRAPPSVRRLFR